MAYVYRFDTDSDEDNSFTVGYYKPDGSWESESEFEIADDAAARCNYLNGGEGLMPKNPNIRPSKRPLIKRSIAR